MLDETSPQPFQTSPETRGGRAESPLKMAGFRTELIREDLRDFAGYSSARTTEAPTGSPASTDSTDSMPDDSQGPAATIWLNANEASTASAVDPEGSHRRYPEPQPVELVQALAQTYGVRPEQVIVGRGSDECIDLLVRTLTAPGSAQAIVQAPPTFGMYAVSARLQGVPVIDVPQRDLGAVWEVDTDGIRRAVLDTAATVVFLASPGNPTGAVVPLEEIETLADAVVDRAVVVVDEAYQEFAGPRSAATLLDAHPNLVVLRTLSKAHGLAGVRLGVALAHPDLADVLRRVQAPYPLPTPVTELVAMALSGSVRRSVDARVAQTRAGREQLAEILGEDPRVQTVWASEANFLLIRTDAAQALLEELRAHGIVVRDMRHLVPDALRVTVGSPEEIEAVREALASAAQDPATESTPAPARGTNP